MSFLLVSKTNVYNFLAVADGYKTKNTIFPPLYPKQDIISTAPTTHNAKPKRHRDEDEDEGEGEGYMDDYNTQYTTNSTPMAWEVTHSITTPQHMYSIEGAMATTISSSPDHNQRATTITTTTSSSVLSQGSTTSTNTTYSEQDDFPEVGWLLPRDRLL